MSGDGRRNIAGEVLVDGCRRIGWQQGDALFDRAAGRRWRVQHGNRVRTAFDDDLGTGANTGKQAGEVAGGLGFRDVEGCHSHDDTSILWLTQQRKEGLFSIVFLVGFSIECGQQFLGGGIGTRMRCFRAVAELGTGMRGGVDLLQLADRHLGIDLGAG